MTKPPQPSTQSQTTLQILRQAVAKALDKKKRLGQCAVVWQDGQPVLTGGEVNALDTPIVAGGKAICARTTRFST